MFILGLCPRINSSSSRFFGASRRELLGVLRTETVFLLFLLLSLSFLSPGGHFPLYILLSLILAVYLLIRSPIRRLPPLAIVAANKVTLFRGHFFINVARLSAAGIKCGGDSLS